MQSDVNWIDKPFDNNSKIIAFPTSAQLLKPEAKGLKKAVYLTLKRTFDIVISSIALILFSWLFAIIAICIKCSDGGPVFYFHTRVGKNGKSIRIPKFRSMKVNADKIEFTLNSEQLKEYYREYKLDDDPRVTKIGHFLRRTSLDELPQFWSIIRNDLSIVGPRPLIPDELESKYGPYASLVVSVKPGLTGYWQAYGRNNITYQDGARQKMELYYAKNASLWLDIKIFFKTFVAVITKSGSK